MRLKILLLVAIASLLVAHVALAAKDYSADRFDVDAAIQEDGSLLVTETVVFRFVGGPFTTAFRDLLADETDGIDEISAAMDGRVLPAGTGPGQVEIKNGRTVNVIWHYEPTSDSTYTFVLSYRLLGVIRQAGDADVLSYRALPGNHDYAIASSTVTVTYPTTARLTGEPSIARGSAVIESGPNRVVFRSSDVKNNRTLQFALRFERGSLISEPPQWQAQRAQHDRDGSLWIGLGAFIIAAGALALAAFWQQRRRSITLPRLGELHTMHPPTELPPALAGLMEKGGTDTDWAQGLATMLDLGRRGILAIEESAQRSWGQRDFVVQLVSRPPDLRPHEDALLRLLFESKKGMAASVKMSDLHNAVSARWSTFTKPLQDEMRAAGLFDHEREQVRRRIMIAAFIVLLAGCASFIPAILLLGRFGGWVMVIPFAVLAVSCLAFIAGAAFSPLSDKAAQERPHWQAFAHYLKDVAKGKEPAVGAQLLEQYLPYAAGFGLGEGWAKLFMQRGDEETLAWFRPLAAADGGRGAFVAMMGVGSSVGGSSAAGGAGAAGGGASGAH